MIVKLKKYWNLVILLVMMMPAAIFASGSEVKDDAGEKMDVGTFIMHHTSDAYEWHISRFGETDVYIPLPVILHSQHSGWHFFMSSEFHEHGTYKGFKISHDEAHHYGKIVEILPHGKLIRPLDLSITKITFALILNSILLIIIILSVSRKYLKFGFKPKKGLAGFMEMFIMMIYDDVIKPSVGKDYRKYAPFLLTLFFFIFFNNLMGLIPIFPFGASVTGNITITFSLALITFIIVNLSGTKEYWREIFAPDVPLLMKFPIPLMPLVEFVGVFTKPFALMIRLFANMLAGHSIIIALISIIFITRDLGTAGHGAMTVTSIVLTIFINFLELLVAFIQAYVFTLLASLYIGLARVQPHHHK